MEKDIFGINQFNVIQDEKNYYLFRALNIDDQREIEEGINSENGKIQKVFTNKQRYSQNTRYANSTGISLKEVWDHTKSVNFYRGTNCISLSSNANVSIDYGSKYGHKYIMVKVPKDGNTSIYNAGQYMLSELNIALEEKIKKISPESEILNWINEIEIKTDYSEIKAVIGERFKKARSSGNYIGRGSAKTRESILERFNKRQAFSEEQQLVYNKIMGKMTLLELVGILPEEIFNQINVSSLAATIGSEFSNREFIHYGEIEEEELVPISRINLDMFALLQIAKEQGVDVQKIDRIEQKIIEYSNKGYELIQRNGRLYYSNKEEEIDLKLGDNSVLFNENKFVDNMELSIEEIFDKTDGRISYSKAKNAAQFVYNLSIAQRKTIELTKVLKLIISEEELNSTLDDIEEKAITINDRIITRKNGRGIQVSESVNIDMNGGERKQFLDEEQRRIYNSVKRLSVKDLDSIIENRGKELEQEIYIGSLIHENSDLGKTKEERLNRYYAEAIIDMLDISKIYRNVLGDKSLTAQERQNIITQLEKADCVRLVNAFIKAGIQESEVSGYIINILASNGYKGYTFEELSKIDDLDDLIRINVRNTNLRGHVYPSVLEEIRGIRDNDNRVEGSLINLRDYQKETVDNVEAIFNEGKRFAGVVLPTGAGKSFVAMTEMLKNRDGNILYIAPQQEILNQVQRHILKYIAKVEVLTTEEIELLKKEQNNQNMKQLILPKGKILPNQVNEYVKKAFPHLKMLCYQGLASQDNINLSSEQIKEKNNEEKELREILKNADADLIIFDELHRSGAKQWKKSVKQLIEANDKANILGITATPIRDVDHVDMMNEMARILGTYSEDELAKKQYLAYEMYLIDAIQRGLVIEPKIVSFDFMLRDTNEYNELMEMIEKSKSEKEKSELLEIKDEIDKLLFGEIDPNEVKKNGLSKNELKEIGRIVKDSIQQKDGRYIVFLPQHSYEDGLSDIEYLDMQEENVRQMLSEIDDEIEIYRLSSALSKTKNHKAVTDFENSNSSHLKVMLAINKLNEGVHIDNINGEIMLRKINDGNVILYLQQLGRVIYALDPNEMPKEEDIPIVFDIYNNFLVQNMNRVVNQTTPKSDLQKLQEIIGWIDKHNYIPDINSDDINEARKAITLKKIKNKYERYQEGINNPRLTKSNIYEIEQVMQLAKEIDLFDMEIGDRIIPPGERDISDVSLFKITAKQAKFLDLFKKANEIADKYENTIADEHENENKRERYKNNVTARMNNVMNALRILRSEDIFIDNNLIGYKDKLKDLIKKCPEESRASLREQFSDYDEEWPIGNEYNFIKSAYRDSKTWKYFENADINELYNCGIFEKVDTNYKGIRKGRFGIIIASEESEAIKNDFIVFGPKSLKNLNVKTGTYYGQDGYDHSGYDIDGYNRAGYDKKGYNKEGFTKTGYDREGYDKRGFFRVWGYPNKITGTDYDVEGYNFDGYDKEGYDREGYNRRGFNKEGEHKITKGLFDEKGFNQAGYDQDGYDKNGYDKNGYDRDGYNRRGYDKNGYNRNGYNRNGYNENGYDREGFNQSGYNKEGYDRNGYDKNGYGRDGYNKAGYDKKGYNRDGRTKKGYDKYGYNEENYTINGFNKEGYYCKKDEKGEYISTGLKYNPAGFMANRRHAITKSAVDLRGFDINGLCKKNNDSIYDERGFKQDGTYQETGELYYQGYNAFNVDRNGKDRNGKVDKDIVFTQGYIEAIANGKRNTYIKSNYKGLNKLNQSKILEEIEVRVYRASLMYPPIKERMSEEINKSMQQIILRERKIAQLEEEENQNKNLIEKLKKENVILRKRISFIDPMKGLDR